MAPRSVASDTSDLGQRLSFVPAQGEVGPGPSAGASPVAALDAASQQASVDDTGVILFSFHHTLFIFQHLLVLDM